MTTETDAPQGVAEAEPVVQPEIQPSDTGAEAQAPETPAEAEAAPAEEPKPKQTPWWQKRIDEITAEKHAERRRAEELERQIEAFRQLTAAAEGTEAGQPGDMLPAAEVDRRAREIAARDLKAQQFNEACNAVFEKGAKEFPDFKDAVLQLNQAGVISPERTDLVEAVLVTDAPEKVLHHLGTNPEEAMRIGSLPAVRMAAELTKLGLKLSESPRPAVSKAPPPESPLSGSAKAPFDPDKADTDAWMAWREQQVRDRAKARAN